MIDPAANPHRNSLGYVVSERGGAFDSSPPMIVWGLAEDGTRVPIADAERGAAQGLKCECSARLVAKKGLVKSHHFAHASDEAAACLQAHMAAVCHLATEALSANGNLRLPNVQGRQRFIVVHDACVARFGDWQGVRVAAAGKKGRRELAILFHSRRSQDLPPADAFKAIGTSAIFVDLIAHKNQSDGQIIEAIRTSAVRRWIYNSKHPEPENQRPPAAFDIQYQAFQKPKPHEKGTGHYPIERSDRGPSSALRITEEEWNTLSPSELRRRLFGNKYE